MRNGANPVLRRLGLSGSDRALIIHADDIGMSYATLPALSEVMAFGLVTSGALMVPCQWFPQAAALCREHPDWDVGVHATVTCEWLPCRWAPLSTLDPASGLIDDAGYMHRLSSTVRQAADPDAVLAEVQAQIARAVAAGLDVTHLDQHMFTLADPRLFRAYARAALTHRVLPLLLRRQGYIRQGVAPEAADALSEWVSEMEEMGWPVFDSVTQLPLRDPEGHVAITRTLVDGLEPGLHLIIVHPATDTPELRAIVPNWQARVANREAMLSSGLRDYVRLSGVRLISYRDLRQATKKG